MIKAIWKWYKPKREMSDLENMLNSFVVIKLLIPVAELLYWFTEEVNECDIIAYR
jgi:hypothetical protein